MPNKVVVVDYDDKPIRVIEKMEAHKKPILHRAFSVFLYNGSKVLLQKRALNKYHSGGLIENAKTRLIEELNIKVDSLKELGTFVYYHKFNENLHEYEYDHVLAGQFNGEYEINPEEVSWLGWVEIEEVKKDIIDNPNNYAVWFITAFQLFLKEMKF